MNMKSCARYGDSFPKIPLMIIKGKNKSILKEETHGKLRACLFFGNKHGDQ